MWSRIAVHCGATRDSTLTNPPLVGDRTRDPSEHSAIPTTVGDRTRDPSEHSAIPTTVGDRTCDPSSPISGDYPLRHDISPLGSLGAHRVQVRYPGAGKDWCAQEVRNVVPYCSALRSDQGIHTHQTAPCRGSNP
jgi:hypothetical protein